VSGGVDTTVVAAFAVGFVSFISPCVLPLVPGYLGYLGGFTDASAEASEERRNRRRLLLGVVLFIAGFTVVFVTFNLLAGVAGAWFNAYGDAITRALGVVLIVMGLVFIGQFTFLQRTVKPSWRPATGLAGAPLLGVVFGLGWTPCIGAVLGSILVLAGSVGSVVRGIVLLVAYSAGIGAAFVVAGVAFSRAMASFRWVRDRYRVLEIAGGTTLVALGLLLFFGRYWWLNVALNRALESVGLDRI
jgi:cytochrome c-type biogenesis protein